METLRLVWDFIVSLVLALLDVGLAVWDFGWGLLVHLHVDYPRLEGLLVGVLLAWLLARRDRHPVIRVLSAPLKLVVDILDLAWDQVVEVSSDLWETGKGWLTGSIGWAWGKVVAAWDWKLDLLRGLRDRLRRS